MEDETKVQIHVIQFFLFCFQLVELKEKQKCEMWLHPQNACIFYNISVNVCLSK